MLLIMNHKRERLQTGPFHAQTVSVHWTVPSAFYFSSPCLPLSLASILLSFSLTFIAWWLISIVHLNTQFHPHPILTFTWLLVCLTATVPEESESGRSPHQHAVKSCVMNRQLKRLIQVKCVTTSFVMLKIYIYIK